MHEDEIPSPTEAGDARGPQLIQPRDADMPPLMEPAPVSPLEVAPAEIPAAASTPMAVPVAIPVQSDDEEIYCPICNYNLTGIHSGRCPECGAFFDRQALIAAQQANQVGLIPWDDPQPMSFYKRLAATLRICLFVPKRFAVAYSVQPQHTKALSFFLGVVAAVAIACSLVAVITLKLDSSGFIPSTLDWISFISACVLFPTILICGSTLLSATMLWLTSPHYDGKRHFKPWLSICAYAASHYLLVLCVVPSVVLGLFTFPQLPAMLIGFTLYGCAGLCGFTLNAVMEHRTAKDRRTMLGFLILLAIHFLGSVPAMLVTVGTVELIEQILFPFLY